MYRRPGIIAATLLGVALTAGACSSPVVQAAESAPQPAVSSQSDVPAGESGKPTEKEIADLFVQWNAALASGAAEKVADRYASDGVLLPTVSNKVRTNRAEIVDYFTHFLTNKPQGTIKQSVINVLDENTAIDTGVYVFTLTTDGKQRQVEARYTFVYELSGGTWLIVNHHSSAMPETTAGN